MDQTVSINVSIDVPDLNAGIAFYGSVFGYAETARPYPTMAILDGGNVTICLHGKAEGTKSSEAGDEVRRYNRHWTPVHLDFHVEALEQYVEKIKANGGTVEREFKNEGPKPVAFCADPFGNGFCVIGKRY